MRSGLLVLITYLIGSLPIGLAVGKLVRGIDVREFGSGNIGASNVWRTLGPVWGVLVFLLDVAKGLLPTLFAQRQLGHPIWLPVAVGLAAIIGHNFSVFLKFHGGKGAATSLGVALGLSPLAGLIGFGVWLVCLALTRYISLSSIIALITGCFFIWQFNAREWPYAGFAVLATVFVLFTHRSNLQRLRDGTERRVGKKSADASVPPSPVSPS